MTTPAAAAIPQMIRAQRDAARTLLGLLAEEKAALLHQQSPEVLETLTAAKTAAVDRLRELAEPLRRLGIAGTAEIERLLATLPGAVQGLQDWRELGALARDCQTANLENAALLEARHRQVRDALRSLRGEADPNVYGRGGYSAQKLGPQRLGSA